YVETTELRQGEDDTLARINVLGTALMSLFCITKRYKRLHYISTAYVAGKRRGVVLEDELGWDSHSIMVTRGRNTRQRGTLWCFWDNTEAEAEFL
ncbi:MAG: hypothetical protein HW406_1526, partial [Candidatus Brocadiaceae bacterium]|nr:hypothetical protein [Candidatus Brocadiaceae bacterium]